MKIIGPRFDFQQHLRFLQQTRENHRRTNPAVEEDGWLVITVIVKYF